MYSRGLWSKLGFELFRDMLSTPISASQILVQMSFANTQCSGGHQAILGSIQLKCKFITKQWLIPVKFMFKTLKMSNRFCHAVRISQPIRRLCACVCHFEVVSKNRILNVLLDEKIIQVKLIQLKYSGTFRLLKN